MNLNGPRAAERSRRGRGAGARCFGMRIAQIAAAGDVVRLSSLPLAGRDRVHWPARSGQDHRF